MATIGSDLSRATQLLQAGECVGIPTETVYGLAGRADRPETLAAIFATKQRPKFDPLILHFANVQHLREHVAHWPESAKRLAHAFWPGPLTMILPKTKRVPDLATSGLPTVAVRIPRHPLTLQLLNAIRLPLAAPSANPFGYVSPTNAQHVNDQLGNKLDYIVDGGDCRVGLESTIIDLSSTAPTILRRGAITQADIEAVIGRVETQSHSTDQPRAPGQLSRHYATTTPLRIGNPTDLCPNHTTQTGERVGVLSFAMPPSKQLMHSAWRQLSPDGDTQAAAANLFRMLRELDALKLDYIIAQRAPEGGLGDAINDRLLRAAAAKL